MEKIDIDDVQVNKQSSIISVGTRMERASKLSTDLILQENRKFYKWILAAGALFVLIVAAQFGMNIVALSLEKEIFVNTDDESKHHTMQDRNGNALAMPVAMTDIDPFEELPLAGPATWDAVSTVTIETVDGLHGFKLSGWSLDKDFDNSGVYKLTFTTASGAALSYVRRLRVRPAANGNAAFEWASSGENVIALVHPDGFIREARQNQHQHGRKLQGGDEAKPSGGEAKCPQMLSWQGHKRCWGLHYGCVREKAQAQARGSSLHDCQELEKYQEPLEFLCAKRKDLADWLFPHEYGPLGWSDETKGFRPFTSKEDPSGGHLGPLKEVKTSTDPDRPSVERAASRACAVETDCQGFRINFNSADLTSKFQLLQTDMRTKHELLKGWTYYTATLDLDGSYSRTQESYGQAEKFKNYGSKVQGTAVACKVGCVGSCYQHYGHRHVNMDGTVAGPLQEFTSSAKGMAPSVPFKLPKLLG